MARVHLRRIVASSRRRDHLVALTILALVACAYMWPLLRGYQLGQGHQLFSSWPWRAETPGALSTAVRSGEGDAASQFDPLLTLARHQLAQGEVPLWNPYTFGGAPLLGDMQSALLFPLTWLALALGVPPAWGWMAVLKLLIAGMGAYALARHLRVRPGAALAAGVVYMLSAPMVAWLQWPLASVFSLFPWLVLATDRLRLRPDARAVGVLGLVGGLGVLAGHPETALLSALATGVYLVGALARDPGRRGAWRSVATRWLAAQILAAGVAAAEVIPFLDAYSRSITRDVHGAFAKLHLPIEGVLLWLTPNVFGDGRPSYTGPLGTYVTTAAYFGIAALGLAALGALRTWRRPESFGLLAMAALALMVVFAVPPVSLIVRNAPGLSSGNNVRVLYVVALAGALLAGLGADSLRERRVSPIRVLVWVSGAGAVVAGGVLLLRAAGRVHGPTSSVTYALGRAELFIVLLAVVVILLGGRRRRTLSDVALLVVLLADLAYLQPYNAILPSSQAYPRTPPSVAFLERQRGPFHLESLGQGFFPPYVMQADTAAKYRLEDLRGYEYPLSKRWADFSFRVLGEHGLTRELILFSPRTDRPSLAAMRMMNVRYYIAPPGFASPVPALRPVYRGTDLTVFEDPGSLPRAYVVGTVRGVRYDGALALMRTGSIDLGRVALVESAPVSAAHPGGAPVAAAAREEGSQGIRVDVPRQSRGGWLVLAQAYDPNWTATVDGGRVAVRPTDLAAMGVALTPGAHVVRFTLSRDPFWVGAAVSLLACGLCGGLILWRRRGTGADDLVDEVQRPM